MSLTRLPGFTLDTSSNVTFANANVTGNLTSGNANLGNAVTANFFIGNGSLLTGLAASYSNTNTAAYLPTYTGNVSANYFIGNGSTLTNITGANITGNAPFAGTANYANTANSVTGTNVSGNVTSAVQAHYANIANSVAGANVSSNVNWAITSNYANTANAVSGTNVSGNVTSANVAYFANVTANSTNSGSFFLTYVSGTGNNALHVDTTANDLSYQPSSGNLTAAQFIGNGYYLTGIQASGITGSYSNTNVAAYLPTYTGNFTAGNINLSYTTTSTANLGNAVRANYVVGNGYYLTGVDLLTVGNADIANSIANGTSNISTPSSGGNITVGIGGTANTVIFSNTGVNVAGTLNVAGNAFVGNLTVTGTTTTVNSTTTRVVDPIFELGGGANGAALSTDDNKDRGLLLHYYSGSSTVDAFMGWDDSNSEFGFGSNISLSSEVVTWNSYANVRGNFFLGNGYYLSGIDQLAAGSADVANAIANGTSNVNTPYLDGPITVGIGGSSNTVVFTSTGINIAGYSNIGGTVTAGTGTGGSITGANAITSNYFIGNGSLLTNITGANITGNAPFAGTANYANTANAVTGANVSGNVNWAITSNYANTANAVAGANVSGNVTSATVSYLANITANSTNSGSFFLTYVSSAGNSALHVDTTANDLSYQPSSGNLTAAQFIGNGYYLTGITATASLPITSGTSNLNILSGGNATVSIGGTANVLVVSSTGINLPYTSGATANLGNLVTANYIDGNGSLLTSVTGANISGQVSNALLAGTVYTNAQPNITSVGTLTSLTVGNATANTTFGNGTITATGNIAFTGANISLGSVSNLNITGGAANYYLKTDGAGALSWSAVTGGGGGGGVTLTSATSPPASGNLLGDQWYNTSSDVLYEYINDGTAAYWVDVSSPSTSTNSAIAGAIIIKDEGSNITTAVSSINFVGAGVTASNIGNAVTVTIPDTLSPFLLMGA